MTAALEVKEDGQIWLIPNCPVEPEYTKVAIAANVGAEAINKVMHSLKGDQYREALASAERILVSNQDVAQTQIWYNTDIHNKAAIKPGIYPIPDLKWEPRTVEKFYESKGWFWEKVAVISLPLESTPSTEQQPFNGCSPTACGCKSLADCPNNQPLAVATFVIQEDEKNGMYEESQAEKPINESQEDIWNYVDFLMNDPSLPPRTWEQVKQKLIIEFTIARRNPQVK